MLTHSDWHDFTVSVLKCKEVRKIYRDHPHCPKMLKLYCIILPLCFYISFTLHNSIHHPNNVTSITAIGTNHAKILAGLKDSQLQNKLAKSKAKKWTTMARFCRMWQIWLLTLKGHVGIHSQHSKSNMFHPQILVPLTGPTSQLQKAHNNHQLNRKSPNVGIARENTTKRTAQQCPSKVLPQNINPQRKNSIT